MMANPEGTQQLRDRDLEFMFYDEAQVGVLLVPLRICGSRGLVHDFSCCCRCSGVDMPAAVAVTAAEPSRPDFNLVVGPSGQRAKQAPTGSQQRRQQQECIANDLLPRCGFWFTTFKLVSYGVWKHDEAFEDF